MRSFAAIMLGVLASFALSILSAQIMFRWAMKGSTFRFATLFIAGPLIALAVGVLVGLIKRNRANLVAVAALAPWVLWLVFAANDRHSAFLHWLVAIASAFVYLTLGIGAANLVGRRVSNLGVGKTI